MLIINADDWGRSVVDTDSTLACLEGGRCTSVSAMVFMPDSKRAADIAREKGIDAGLHLNFSESFDPTGAPAKLRQEQSRTMRFLRFSKYAQLVYNPLLRSAFNYVVRAQFEEFNRLYSRPPSHVDGHQHLHLCCNLLIQHPIPDGFRVRRNFTFDRGEKGFVNRAYRAWVDRGLERRYNTTDSFFSLESSMATAQINRILQIARNELVELMTHPRFPDESHFLLGDLFGSALGGVELVDHGGSQRPPVA